MTYTEAITRAKVQSKQLDCGLHVNATIIRDSRDRPVIDADGYTISDWYDGTTVASFAGGKELSR